MRRALAGCALAIAALAHVTPAHANGRAPATNGVFFQANDAQSIYVRTTFGLLISHDGGCSFRWTCEDSIGYGGTYDPEYAVGSDGALWATTYTGLRVSRDGGCTYETPIAGRYIGSLDLGAGGAVWAVTADSAMPNAVLRSTDGATFATAGLGSSALLWNSVKVAPSDPATVYVAGYQLGSGAHFYATATAGSAWTESALAGVAFGETPQLIVAAIDPTNAAHVFAISVAAHPPGDVLYRSLDGGATFAQVLATSQAIAGVLDVDGSAVIVAGGSAGSYRSTDGGATFAPLAGAPQLSCIGKRPDGSLVGCGANWEPDYMAVAATTDLTTWTKLFRFAELDGVLGCPAGTVDHDDCDLQQWPTISAQFGVVGPTCASATDLPAVDGLPQVHVPDRSACRGCAGGGDASAGAALAVLALALAGYRNRRQSRT